MEETIKINENDVKLIRDIIDIDAKVKKCQLYIKENFSIDSIFYPETLSIRLFCNNINESLQLLSAKSYIKEIMDEDSIKIEF